VRQATDAKRAWPDTWTPKLSETFLPLIYVIYPHTGGIRLPGMNKLPL